MAHMVICAICGKKYDRDYEPTTLYSTRRYAHQECYPEGEIVTPDVKPKAPKKSKNPVKITELGESTENYNRLKDYIQYLFGKEYCNWSLITKQITTYITENGYSCSGMMKTLHWHYEVKANPRDYELFKERGLALMPYIYPLALDFYKKLYDLESMYAENNVVSRIKDTPTFSITIKSPRVKDARKKKFNLDEDGE